jgi:hypothetical protein
MDILQSVYPEEIKPLLKKAVRKDFEKARVEAMIVLSANAEKPKKIFSNLDRLEQQKLDLLNGKDTADKPDSAKIAILKAKLGDYSGTNIKAK